MVSGEGDETFKTRLEWSRIDAYRNATGKTLQEVSDAIGVGRSMLMMVKSGRRNLSGKALYRLEQAEIEAGLKPELIARAQLTSQPSNPAKSGAKKSINCKQTIPDRIECLRVKLRLTKAEVYDKLEISQPMVSMVRKGLRQPSLKTLRRIEAAEKKAGIGEINPAKAGKQEADKSSVWSYTSRLERLKIHHCATWGEICDLLQVNRSMMHYLRTGERQPSPKLLRRIEEAEKEAGIEGIIPTRELIIHPKTPAKAGISGSGKSIIWKKRVSGELAKIREEMAQWGARLEALERELQVNRK